MVKGIVYVGLVVGDKVSDVDGYIVITNVEKELEIKLKYRPQRLC